MLALQCGYRHSNNIEPLVIWIHASALNIETKGLLIRGPSRAGKSQLLLHLLDEADRKGLFGSLIADDRLGLYVQDGFLAAKPHPLIQGMVENRPLGIIKRPFLPTSRVHAVIDIIPPHKLPSFSGDNHLLTAINLEGVELPLMMVSQHSALAETTAKVFSLVLSL